MVQGFPPWFWKLHQFRQLRVKQVLASLQITYLSTRQGVHQDVLCQPMTREEEAFLNYRFSKGFENVLLVVFLIERKGGWRDGLAGKGTWVPACVLRLCTPVSWVCACLCHEFVHACVLHLCTPVSCVCAHLCPAFDPWNPHVAGRRECTLWS